MIVPTPPGSYEQERLALWLEVGRISDATLANSALMGATRDRLEHDTAKDLNELGNKFRRLDRELLVIKTKATAYGATAAFVVSMVLALLKYFIH